ncbi:MAG: site-specific integrase [Sphingobacteriales bacterium]|nr:site-specific integrase [Sphingobacteriales bacterium]
MQKRDEVIMAFLIYQALTVLEVTQIEISQIDLEKGTIQVTGNVKNKGRTLHFKANQIMLFYKYINGTRAGNNQ